MVEKHFSMLGLQNVPVWITQEQRRYYEDTTVYRSQDEALTLAYDALSSELSALSEGSQLLRKDVVTTLTDHSVILDCTVLCIENIAVQSEFEVDLNS